MWSPKMIHGVKNVGGPKKLKVKTPPHEDLVCCEVSLKDVIDSKFVSVNLVQMVAHEPSQFT